MSYSNNSNGKIMLIGDFNSRTGSLSDFIEPHIDDHMFSHSRAPSITSQISMVKGSSNYARAYNYPSLMRGKKVVLLECLRSFQIRGS